MKTTEKTLVRPLSYYGGKENLKDKILPLIPEHQLYCEPFLGGASIFFAKPQSAVEVINDTNSELINFYRVVQRDFVSLEQEVRISLHSRRLHSDAKAVYENPHLFSEIKRAWAVWVLANQSFSSMLDGTWGYDVKKNTTSKKITNKRESFTEDYAIRLQNAQIECTDALRIINSRDRPDSFFYIDPPYFNSDCGHYDGYTEKDFVDLLTKLECLEGKFLLSSYDSPVLKEFVKRSGWKQQMFQQMTSVNGKGKRKPKVEVLTANYLI
jgi:DNA adenine methylase